MKNKRNSTLFALVALMTMSNVALKAQTQTSNPAPAAVTTQGGGHNPQTAKPMSEEERKAQEDKMKADRELNVKIAQLNKEVQEAEKAGKAEAPETVAKKAELKKLQEERSARMRAEREKMMKDRAANPSPAQQEMVKMNQLNKEIQEAEKAGKADAPETVAKKAELKKMQEERNARMKVEREKMMQERPMPTPEEIEANKKMGQLNKEIRDAEKEGKGETPEIVAKKAELKKLQDARVAKMKADREKMAKEKNQTPSPVKNDGASPVKESK